MGLSLIEEMERIHEEIVARDADPWRRRLEHLHGKIGDDGIERIPTQMVYDILEVPGRCRGSAANRRLAGLMAELGGTAMRIRGMAHGAYGERVRGYARTPSVREPLFSQSTD